MITLLKNTENMFISLIKGLFGLDIEEGQTNIPKKTVENNIDVYPPVYTEHSENMTEESSRNVYISFCTGLFSLNIRRGESESPVLKDPNENKNQAGPLTHSEQSGNETKQYVPNVHISKPINIIYRSSYRHWKARQLSEWPL